MNELTKQFMCISMRNGVELWVEDDRIKNLKGVLRQLTGTKFVDLGSEMINSADITGIYEAKTMEDLIHRRNGERLCKYNTWHTKNDTCMCGHQSSSDVFVPPTTESASQEAIDAVRAKLSEKQL